MNRNDCDFPPNAQEIRKHLEVCTDFIYEKLDAWTCDQAAQVVSGIDPHGFNQNDADNFIGLSKILNSCAIANTISPIEKTGEIYLKPLDVIKWAIDNEYKLSIYLLDWQKEQQCAKLLNPNTGIDNDETNKDLTPREGGYKKRDIFAISLVSKQPNLLNMRKKQIKIFLLNQNSKLFTAGFNDWWREQPIFPKGKPGRIPK